MGRIIKDVEAYIDEAITNIRDDRSITSALLADVFTELKQAQDVEVHRTLGVIASKYVETLQRSNEQLVKIAAILNKRKDVSESLDEEDKKELFDMIQGGN
jgi:hypothetical protein